LSIIIDEKQGSDYLPKFDVFVYRNNIVLVY